MLRKQKQPAEFNPYMVAERRQQILLLKKIRLIVGVFLGIVVVLQLLYPSNRALPYASVNGSQVGWRTTAELGPMLQNAFETTTTHLVAANSTYDAKLTALGADIEETKTAEQLMNYPWWQRLLPFSFAWMRPEVSRLSLTFDTDQLGNAASTLSHKLAAEPKNGDVSLSAAGEVVLTKAEDGVKVTSADITSAIKGAKHTFGTYTVTVAAATTKPSVTNQTIQEAKKKVEVALQKSITIKNSIDTKTTYTPEKADIAAWIHIGDNLSLSLDKEKVVAYANRVASAQLIAAGTTKVTLVDGIEKGRSNGTTGRGVSVDALVTDLTKAALQSGSTSVTMHFVTVQPTVVYDRSYTNSQAALQAYINEVTSGGNIEVSVTQLDGAKWSASSGASKSVVSASTYKLYMALLLFDKINAGQLHWSDSIQGTNVEQCLYNMIVLSANNCAEQWIDDWGRSAINSALYGKGFSSSTTFTASDATHTSAQDLQKLLISLYKQTLFNSPDAGRLLGLMKQQVYRKGIPAGSAGTVADKVGFLWDYLNDTAIVYHPRGTYVLVVMTKGESWGKIAEITAQIEDIMYP